MIPAVVLAAGKSSRMGRTKALLPIGSTGETFLTRIIRTLREGGVEAVVVVIGGDAAAVRASLPREDASISAVDNPRYEEGQLSSLLVGLAAVEERHGHVEAVMVTLVDLTVSLLGVMVALPAALVLAGAGAEGAPRSRPSAAPRARGELAPVARGGLP